LKDLVRQKNGKGAPTPVFPQACTDQVFISPLCAPAHKAKRLTGLLLF
jgi:hypothetical protein